MNQFLPAKFDERIWRLALGIEVLDAMRDTRIAHPIRITFDQVPRGLPRPRIVRHDSCVFVLLFGDGVDGSVELRLFDAQGDRWRPQDDRRRFVPRRLRIPLLSQARADQRPYTERVRRPALFPGAAYDVSETATGLRGRVERGGVPVRWARVEAVRRGTSVTVGRAHCDDRGEFLLLIEPRAAPLADLSDPVTLDLVTYAPNPPAAPVADAIKALDPLWDLPVEVLPAPGQPDSVSAGALPWVQWSRATATTVSFPLGRLRREHPALTV